ncbi:MAG: nucleoporin complex subunit 54-domain-containing protein [Benniella sp.]|nr:MAG: nucleoporin complex subunit 54-domain-containing protein [Benniella sp.]
MSGFTFGAPAAAPAGGSLFGAAAATPAAGTSFFGAKPAAPATGGLFGAAPAASTAGTGLFGAAPATAPAAGGLFGAAPATSTAGTGLFGAAPATSAGTGLFGGAASTPAAGGLFGVPAASTTPAAGGLFGAAPAASGATTGFFGGATSSTPQASGGLFGATATAAQASGGFFGARPGTLTAPALSFGASTAAPAAGSLFGSAPKPFGSGFGASTTLNPMATMPSLGSSLASGPRQQYVIGNAKPQIPVWQSLMYIKNAWDPTHPNCQFKHYFYNFVHPDDVNKYGPPLNVDPYEWHQALLECPDRECMVPALAVGFEDLKKRMESQNEMTEIQRVKLDEIEGKMNEIMQFHLLQTAAKVREFKRRHIQLSQRVLTLMKRVQILRNRGVPIRADEEALRVRLENALEQLRNPAHFRGKITELWAQIQILKDSKRLHPTGNYEVADEAQLETIGKFLQDQQAGLQHVTAVIQQDMHDIEILQRKLEEIGSTTRA